MPLDEKMLANLMFVTYAASGFVGTKTMDDFNAIATGVVAGLKAGTASAMVQGVQGSPGTGKMIGVINPGPVVMAGALQVASMGSIPPPMGLPTPLQALYFLAIGQIATHILTMQVETLPMDTVAMGVGMILPGGFTIVGSAIEGLIIVEFLKSGPPTPPKLGLAKAIGIATQQIMMMAMVPAIPILGGVPIPPPAGPIPAVGVRTVMLS